MKTTFANAVTKTVDAADSVFFFREIGAGPDTPLILLNHLTDDLEDWDPEFVEGLAANHRIIIFDKRAIGGLAGTAMSNISDLALDAIKFIAALGLKLVDLVGFSMGAFVAQQIVHERPDLVRRVFLAGSVPVGH
jgi:pimeloyl-ACP methyl ester carboxylesterase